MQSLELFCGGSAIGVCQKLTPKYGRDVPGGSSTMRPHNYLLPQTVAIGWRWASDLNGASHLFEHPSILICLASAQDRPCAGALRCF